MARIRDKQELTKLAPEEQAVVNFSLELLHNRKVSQATFDTATAKFGQRGTMTLSNLIACYAVLSYNMNTYELEAARASDGEGIAGIADE
jgi:hypothetical protein